MAADPRPGAADGAAPDGWAAQLAALGDLAADADRDRAACDVVHAAILADPSEMTRHRIRAEVKRMRLVPLAMFDAAAAEAARQAAPADDDAEDDGARLPEGARQVPGSPGTFWIPRGDASPGRVLEVKGETVRELLPWAPEVVSALAEPGDADGELVGLHYDLAAGPDRRITSGDDLISGRVWELMRVPGVGAKRMRELLSNVVLAQAAEAPRRLALTSTGWHGGDGDDGGAMFYVFADGRSSAGDHHALIHGDPALRTASAPVVPDLAAVPGALALIAEHGRGLALAGLGLGARALGLSLHRVPGGVVCVGLRNTGKSSAAWHGETLLIARPDGDDPYPPIPVTIFTATQTSSETQLNFLGDALALIDDGSLNRKSSALQDRMVNDRLEAVFRSFFNRVPIRPRSSRSLEPMRSNFVRGFPVATLQELPSSVDPSLLRRFLLIAAERGDADVKWYRDHAADEVAGMVRPLRTLGEHVLIPHIAAQGDRPAARRYLAELDRRGAELLAPELDALTPGWADDPEGIQTPAAIAAAAVGGLLMIADAVPAADSAAMLAAAVPYLARKVADQRRIMGDEADADTVTATIGEVITDALLRGAAHVCDDQGRPAPVLPGLAPSQQGLFPAGVGEHGGRGAPFYWLPEIPAVGVRSADLFALMRAARDVRMPAPSPKALPRALVAAGSALPATTKASPYVWEHRVGPGRAKHLVMLHPEILFSPEGPDHMVSSPGHPGHPGQPSSDGVRADLGPIAPALSGTQQVSGSAVLFGPEPEPEAAAPDTAPDLARPGCPGSGEPFVPWLPEVLAYLADCRSAGLAGKHGPSPAGAVRNVTAGMRLSDSGAEAARAAAITAAYEVATDPQLAAEVAALSAMVADRPEAAAVVPAPRTAPEAPRTAPEAPQVPAAAPATPVPAVTPRPAPRARQAPAAARDVAFAVLAADGRAHGPDGAVTPAPVADLAALRNVGDLAALAMTLRVRRLYVPAEVREALGLPAALPETLGIREGWPHMFAEGTDAARWDIWPNRPVGLSGWLAVSRLPSTLHESVSVVFPEWLREVPAPEGTPQLGDLAPADLASALTLIWRATTYGDSDAGGVHFHRSPSATMGRLMETAGRRRRSGELEALGEVPPPYRHQPVAGRRPAPGDRVRMPSDHAAPAREVPAGWVLAELDVRSCYASAAASTDFGVGQPQHYARPAAEVRRMPGIHRVTARAGATVISPDLWPLLPAPRDRRELDVSAWLDTTAVAWLDGRGAVFDVAESWAWPERSGRRVYASPLSRLLEAKGRLSGLGTPAGAASAAVVKSMYAARLGGDLASDYAGDRPAGDPGYRPDHWVTIRTQAEVRKQRNLMAGQDAGTPVIILAEGDVDSVIVAAPTLAELEAMPGSGRNRDGSARLALGPGNGRFAVKRRGEVTPELSAVLAEPGSVRRRLAVLRAALAAEGMTGDE
jgi:hypothetical protein